MTENLSKPVMLLAGMGSLDSFGMRLSSLGMTEKARTPALAALSLRGS